LQFFEIAIIVNPVSNIIAIILGASDRYLTVWFRLPRTTKMPLCCISTLLGWNELWHTSED